VLVAVALDVVDELLVDEVVDDDVDPVEVVVDVPGRVAVVSGVRVSLRLGSREVVVAVIGSGRAESGVCAEFGRWSDAVPARSTPVRQPDRTVAAARPATRATARTGGRAIGRVMWGCSSS
jgi:hypothetical protein